MDSDNDENAEAAFKKLVKDGNQIYLKPLNESDPIMDMTDKPFTIVGCVVEKRKRAR